MKLTYPRTDQATYDKLIMASHLARAPMRFRRPLSMLFHQDLHRPTRIMMCPFIFVNVIYTY